MVVIPLNVYGQDICKPSVAEWDPIEMEGSHFNSVDVVFDIPGEATCTNPLFVNVDNKFLRYRAVDINEWVLDTLLTTTNGELIDVAFPSQTSDTLIVAEEKKLLMSSDSGSTFERIDNGLNLGDSETIEGIQTFMGTPRTIYVSTVADTTGNLYRTKDYGQRWEKVTPSSDTTMSSYAILDYNVKPKTQWDSVIVRGTSADTVKLWKGSNAGSKWNSMSQLLPEKKLIHFGPGIQYGSVVMATQDSIYHRESISESTEYTAALPNGVEGFKYLEQFNLDEKPLFIFVSIDNEVMVNFNGADSTWAGYGQNLPDSASITSLDYNECSWTGCIFFITTKQQGLYARSTRAEGSISQNSAKIDGFKLKANYPNPFNPSTEIRFRLPRVTEVRLTVHDLLGRKVATLVDERLPAGSRTVTFDAGNLSSGVYLYRLQADGYSETRKMLLVK